MCKFIGIDISKASFDVAYQKNNGRFHHLQLTNDPKGYRSLFQLIDQQDHCIMEASGPYYLKLAYYLSQREIKVSVINPLQIKHFVRMRMIKAKTDKKDAQMIALYGQSERPDLWDPDHEVLLRVQQINTAIEGLHKQASILGNQLEAFNQSPVRDIESINTLRGLLRSVKAKTDKLDMHMAELVQQHYKETCQALTSIKGIGLKTAVMLIVVTNNFTKFDNCKKLSAYVGLAPRIFESGTSIKGKGHITKMGNRYMRKLLYMGTWSAKKYNAQCREMYQRLQLKGKPERVIKIAIANKLLRQAFAIGSNLSQYDDNYQKKLAF